MRQHIVLNALISLSPNDDNDKLLRFAHELIIHNFIWQYESEDSVETHI